MEKIELKVDGMTCANCALSVSKYLEKEGVEKVKVNLMGGDVSFDSNDPIAVEKIKKGIEKLGYKVADEKLASVEKKKFLETPLQKFWFCVPFTLVLMMHMLPWHIHFLMNPWIQMLLCLPVYILGMAYFGKSAINSLRNGIPNMNVLITLGATAAFVYSLIGAIYDLGHEYIYFETAATIITLVLLGNYLEARTLTEAQRALKDLTRHQKVMATMIAYDDEHREQHFQVEQSALRNGDLLLIKNGGQVPADCKILSGEAEANEAIITGESNPVKKKPKDQLIGGSILESGTVKVQVTAVGKDTVLSKIVSLASMAQGEKPPVQLLADKISAIFVPAVILISIITFLVNYYAVDVPFTGSLMRSIAVLVIACPCAMGLATPAAIAVGLGRAARNGILFKDAKTLEFFKDIKQVVFDKTGTLTTGKFTVSNSYAETLSESEFKNIVYSMEKFSNHPIAKSIVKEWKVAGQVNWKHIEEIKGVGMTAVDKEGNEYMLGSSKILDQATDASHDLYLPKNKKIAGWLDITDEPRPEAGKIIDYFKARGITPILLSGDTEAKCKSIANKLGIDKYYAEQTPADKLNIMSGLVAKAPTIMVGDGINDAPALAKSTIAVSIGDASQIAIQHADVVLMNTGLKQLGLAVGLGKHTYITINQNLFWAFAYNIFAIPIAAAGMLMPGIAALVMGLSDVVLAINSIRLRWKNVV